MANRQIISPASVKSYLAINGADLDFFIGESIAFATGSIEEHLQRKIVPTDVEEILDGTGYNWIKPTYWPVIDLVGVDEAAKLANMQHRLTVTDSWQNVLSDIRYLRIDPQRPWFIYIISGFQSFPLGQANIRLEYTTGYDPVPQGIKQVALEMVAKMYQESNNGQSSLGLQSQSLGEAGGSGSKSFLDMNERWMKILDAYKENV